MNKYILSLTLLLLGSAVQAQNTFEATIKDKESREPLVGVSVYIVSMETGNITDADGRVFINDIPDGKHRLQISYIGYEELNIERVFPLMDALRGQTFYLSPAHEEMEEIVITSTRSSRTIEDIPTRVELLPVKSWQKKGT